MRPTMQIITKNLPKFIVVAIMMCSLLITWESSNTDILGWETSAPSSTSTASTRNTDDSYNSVEAVDSIWNNMSQSLNLNHHTQSAQVQREIKRLIADQGRLYHILTAATPYIYYIYQQTQEHGLPAELALIPVIESEFNPNDHSNKGALGLWQLMPETARELGVQTRSGYDGRRNVVDSTEAALAYFKDLGNSFNDNWYLAIAAYNCGQGKVLSAERRTGNHDFWNLPLPKETEYYVPRLLAVAEIVKNPEKYGVQLPPVNNKPYFSEVKVNKEVSLTSVAKKTGINIDTLHKLNPDVKHDNVVAKKGTYSILVPVSKTPVVKAQLAAQAVVAPAKKVTVEKTVAKKKAPVTKTHAKKKAPVTKTHTVKSKKHRS